MNKRINSLYNSWDVSHTKVRVLLKVPQWTQNWTATYVPHWHTDHPHAEDQKVKKAIKINTLILQFLLNFRRGDILKELHAQQPQRVPRVPPFQQELAIPRRILIQRLQHQLLLRYLPAWILQQSVRSNRPLGLADRPSQIKTKLDEE